MTTAIFQLSFPVTSLAEARELYCATLGAELGRVDGAWADVILFGHPLTLHELLIDDPSGNLIEIKAYRQVESVLRPQLAAG